MAITALHVATIYGCIPMVHLLIKMGVDVNAIDGFRCTPLHYSIMGCRSDNTAHLLSGTYTNNTTDVIVTTHAHLSIIEILLEAGASCHIQFAINTAAPLYLAVQTGNVKCCRKYSEIWR